MPSCAKKVLREDYQAIFHMEDENFEESGDGTFDPDFVDPYSIAGQEEGDISMVFCAKCAREFPSYQAKMESEGAICPDCASEMLAAARHEEEKGEQPQAPGAPQSEEQPAAVQEQAPEPPKQAAEPDEHVYQAQIKRYNYEDFKKNGKKQHSQGRLKKLGGIGMGGMVSAIMQGVTKALLGGSMSSERSTLEGLLDNAQYPVSLFSGELGRAYEKMEFGERQKVAYGYAFLKKVDDARFTLGDIISRLGTNSKIRTLKTLYFAAPTQKAGEQEFPPLTFDRAYDIVEKIYRDEKNRE